MSAFESQTKIVLRRCCKAPRERVFRAWTDREELERWFSPAAQWPACVTELNLQVGGGFEVVFGPFGGEPFVERCEYRAIDVPKFLMFSSVVSREGSASDESEDWRGLVETLCTVELNDQGDETEVVLTVHCPDSAAGELTAGWSATLENLALLTSV